VIRTKNTEELARKIIEQIPELEGERFLTSMETKARLVHSRSWLYKNKDEELYYYKVGGIRLYPESAVEAYRRRNLIQPRKPYSLTDDQLRSLTNPLENPYLDIGGEISEMPKPKGKNKTRFPLRYGGCVYIRPYPSGKESWGIEYRDENNEVKKQIVRNAQAYKDAVIACRKAQAEAFDKRYNIKRRKERIRFFDFSDKYLTYAQTNKERSWKTDRSYLNSKNGLKEFFGDRYMDEFESPDIEEYKIWKIEQEVPNRKTLTLTSKSTANRSLAVLSRMFTLAVEWKYLSREQVPKIKLFRLGDNSRKETLSHEKEGRLFRAFNESPEYLEPIVITALYDGLRQGEIFNLMWKNLDFEIGDIILEGDQTKNRKGRHVPIHPKLTPWLTELHRKNGNSPYVFVNPRTGKPSLE